VPISPADPVLVRILRAARDATRAERALLLAVDGDQLVVVAADGDGVADALDARVEIGVGVAGFVAASGQPVALRPSSSDQRLADDVAAALGLEPSAVLTVPCIGDDGVTGVLELLDTPDGGGFDFNAVEDATLLGGIAGVALEAGGPTAMVASPAELSSALGRLAEMDPARYTLVATMVSALLDRD
jgi:GAF domain-containing protein